MNHGGFIYAIGARGTALVKIGCTRTTVEERLRVLQIGQPFLLYALATVAVESDLGRVEHQVHTLLAGQRRRGEWFEVDMDADMLTTLVLRAAERVEALGYKQPLAKQAATPTLLGARVKRARERLGISQAELARRTNTSANAINLLEQGTTYDPRASRIIAVSRALGVSADYLLGLTEEPSQRREREESELEPAALAMVGT